MKHIIPLIMLFIVPMCSIAQIIPPAIYNQGAVIYISSGATLHIKGDLNNNSGDIANAGNLNLTGQASNNGSFSASTEGTLSFIGTLAQAINGAQTISANNVVVNNNAGISLSTPFEVSGSLTFTSGLVNATNVSAPLIFTSTGTVNGTPTDASHVNGYVKKLGTGGFTFPVGIVQKYQPIAVNLTTNASGLLAQYVAGDAGTGPFTVTGTEPFALSSYNTGEYWNLAPVSTAEGTVTLNWDNYQDSYAYSLPERRVANKVSGNWQNEGGTATGTTTAGGITSNSISSFRLFTLGSFTCTNASITSVTADMSAVCRGSTTTLTANGVSGTNATVNWYNQPNGGGSLLGTGTTLSNVGAGTYYALVTANCGTPAEASVTVAAINATTSDTTAYACSTYTWHDSTYTSSGDYNYKTINAAGCDSTVTLHLTISNMSAYVQSTNANICGGESTNLDVVVSTSINLARGIDPYQYVWSNGETTSTITVTPLVTTTYTVTVTDPGGCTAIDSIVITVNQPTASDTTATVCNKFTWHDSTYKVSTDAIWHTTNAAGCDSTITLHLTITSVTSTTTKTDAICYGTATGSITVNPTYGVSPFTYRIGTVASYVATNTFNNLRAGKYTVSILDANGCAGITDQITITQPVTVTGSASSTPVTTCFGSATGSITVNPSAGVAPFMYKLGNTGTFGTSNVFSNVKGGKYIVYLQDANTCVGYTSVTVSQPTRISAAYTKTDETCPNALNGSVTVSPTGGTPPYSYRFGGSGAFTATNTFSNLKAGSYRIFVNDANNCSGYSILTTVGQTSPTCTVSTRNMAAKTDIAATQQGLAVQLSPNPSNSYFTLRVKATNQEAVQVRVIDVNGKSLFTAKGMAEQTFRFGESFAPGVYMVEVREGNEVKTLKAVKVR